MTDNDQPDGECAGDIERRKKEAGQVDPGDFRLAKDPEPRPWE